MRADPRGSAWRRWALHFHTTASFDYENKGLSPKQIAEPLVEASVSVVAVTDHHFIDTFREYADVMDALAAAQLRRELDAGHYRQLVGKRPLHFRDDSGCLGWQDCTNGWSPWPFPRP